MGDNPRVDATAQIRAALALEDGCRDLALALAPGETIPTELVALTELESLRISCPAPLELPRWFARMRGLSWLELDATLARVPEWLAQLDTLERVTLRCSGELGSALFELPRLSELELELDELGEIPLRLAERRCLDTVRIRAKTLTRVPLGLLVAPAVRELTLDIARCVDPPPAFPRVLPGLGELELLAIGGWPLGEIPDVLLLPRLESLTLRRCGLTRLPDDWGPARGLRHLDVSHNDLRRLPASLAQLTSLRSLVAGHNPLVKLDPALDELRELARVDLS